MLGEAEEEKWSLNKHSSNVPSYEQPVSSDSTMLLHCTAYLTRIKAQTSTRQLISPHIASIVRTVEVEIQGR